MLTLIRLSFESEEFGFLCHAELNILVKTTTMNSIFRKAQAERREQEFFQKNLALDFSVVRL